MGVKDRRTTSPGGEEANGEPMPAHFSPMLALLGRLPVRQSAYGFEYKWDGMRLAVFYDGGRVRLESRSMLDVTSSYPELQGLEGVLPCRQAVIDGELIALDSDGRPSFARLQHRIGVTGADASAKRAAEIPVSFMAFDILYLDGHSTYTEPYTERRRLLEGLKIAGPHWQTPPSYTDEGTALLAAARKQGLEGIVAKKLDSPYKPGVRSPEWTKVKLVKRQEFVVGGWTPLLGTVESSVGSILVGYYEDKNSGGRSLRFAGKVGSGFTETERERLALMLKKVQRADSPFDGKVDPRGVSFAEPELVAEVEYRGWTGDRHLRQPAYKGLRDDKPPGEVILEET